MGGLLSASFLPPAGLSARPTQGGEGRAGRETGRWLPAERDAATRWRSAGSRWSA